jgi:hypothetical protein
MHARLGRIGAAVAALAALAFGATALASAAGGWHATPSTAAHVHLTRARTVARAQHLRATARTRGEDPTASEYGEEQQGENGPAPGSDGDAAAQAAACQKAGVDPNADNVQYDDQTGVCSLDTGSSAGG